MKRFALLVFLCMLSFGIASQVSRKPNLVWITVDTLRADHLSLYGYERRTSPHVDHFAKKAVVFEQFVANETETGPSMAAMFTGKFPQRLGMVDNGRQLPSNVRTVAAALLSAGYKTASVISSPNVGQRTGLVRGFEEIIEVWKGLPKGVEDPKAEFVTNRALAVLQKLREGPPFFLYIHYLDPHATYRPPPPYDRLFVGDRYYRRLKNPKSLEISSAPPAWGEEHYLTTHIGRIFSHVALGTQTDLNYYVSQYDGEIRYVDEQIGRLLDYFRNSRVLENSVIVITADHGESLGEHYAYFVHGTNVYDEQALVPLIIRIPGVSSRRVRTQISGVDLFPTLMRILGQEISEELDGESFASLLYGKERSERPVLIETGPMDRHAYKHALRTSRWKLIFNEDGVEDLRMKPKSTDVFETGPWGIYNFQKRYELYDLWRDSEERRNVAADDQSLVTRLKLSLLKLALPGTFSAGLAVEDLRLDRETLELLRSLGYIKEE